MASGPLLTVNAVVGAVRMLRPRRLLDIGMGTGKWGFLLREQIDLAQGRERPDWTLTIDGIEGFPDYIGDHQRSVYDTIHVGDAPEFLRAYAGERYNVALALDIIEHFEPEAGAELAREALRIADVLVITTPKRFFAQDSDSNPLQRHYSWWPRASLKELATRLDSGITITQTVTTNIAVLSRQRPVPKVQTDTLVAALSALRDRLVPELMYYRVRSKTGPML